MTEISSTKSVKQNKNNRLLYHSFAFVFGFTIIFVIGWGGTVTLLGRIVGDFKDPLAKIGGVVVILFGLATMGVINLPLFNYDTRLEWQNSKGKGLFSSSLMGVFFAAGWTPCIGTTLGAILTMAFSLDTSIQAMVLSGYYALGLGVPFILLGAGMEKATKLVRRLSPHLRKFQIFSGLFLIMIGLLILSNRITLIAIWAQRNSLFIDLPFGGGVPSASLAFLAGLLSFLSPCVLPLVPAYLGYLSGHALVEMKLDN